MQPIHIVYAYLSWCDLTGRRADYRELRLPVGEVMAALRQLDRVGMLIHWR